MADGGRLAERSERTRVTLLRAARELFAAHGYEGTRLDDVVAAAGVTKGALYHHFAGKPELFRAVYEQIEAELAQRSAAAAQGARDPVEMLRLGMTAFLDACAEPDVRRVVLLDGLPVLGWETWSELGRRHNLGLLTSVLEAAMAGGAIRPGPVLPLAHLLQGALIQAGMALGRAQDPATAREETAGQLGALLEGLRA